MRIIVVLAAYQIAIIRAINRALVDVSIRSGTVLMQGPTDD